MTAPLRKMLGLIDAVNRAQFSREPLFKEKTYTEEQQAMLDFYEPAARIFCRNNGKNPDQMCDCMSEASELSGSLPVMHRMPTWHLVVDTIHDVYRAIAEATITTAQAQEAAPVEPPVAH